MFEHDLDALTEFLQRPHPEFFGEQIHDQPGGELQWKIVGDMRGRVEPPISERIQFTIKETTWMDGLARAMQEALARLCGQSVNQIKGTRFFHYVRHNSMGEPMSVPSHPDLKHHAEQLDFMLHETQKELDHSRAYTNEKYIERTQMKDTINILAKERQALRHQRAKKDYTIAHLRARIASLEQTVKDQETQLKNLEEAGEDIQGEEHAYLSNDDDFEEDGDEDLDDLEFIDIEVDDFIPVEEDPEEPLMPEDE